MRTTYGKLMYLLMDSQNPDVQDLLGFSSVKPIVTVYSTLKEGGIESMLEEDLIHIATQEVSAEGRTRREVQAAIKRKERAIETLATKYSRKSNRTMDEEEVRQCLYSISTLR